MSSPEVLLMVYDLRDAPAWRQAHEHRRLWGRRFADCHVLDEDHVVIVFRPAGRSWQPWEERRLRWILGVQHPRGSEAA